MIKNSGELIALAQPLWRFNVYINAKQKQPRADKKRCGQAKQDQEYCLALKMTCKNKGWYRSAAKWIGKIKNWYQVAAKCICKNKD